MDSGGLTVAVTGILAAITAYYAWVTRGMLREMQASRKQVALPRVFAYAERGKWGPVVVLRNGGGGSAFGVEVVNTSDHTLTFAGQKTGIGKGEHLVDGLFLAPEQAVRTIAVFATMGAKPEDYPPVEVDCRWQDTGGRQYIEKSVIAFGSVLHTVNPGSLDEIADQIRDVARDLSSLRLSR